MITLRPYQLSTRDRVYEAWKSGAQNVLAVLATGGGKTACASDILRNHQGASAMIAHRQELVLQISQALARNEVPHAIHAPLSVVKLAVSQHMEETGRSWYNHSAKCAVAGVDTLIRRGPQLQRWLDSATLVIMDEAHHVLRDNKWGKAVQLFRNARFLGLTATPCRADGRGLGRHADGIMDTMVLGPSMRQLIDDRFLTDYRVFAPPSDLDLSTVKISAATGDYNPADLRKATHKSHLHGDVVQHYLRIAKGKLGITFAVDVESAEELAAEFRASGVPAAALSAKTPDSERISTLAKFRKREILQLVNVDLFGEGFDLPAIEVVSMARPTESYSLYVQSFGRALRPMVGKDSACIIDHVGNVLRHGLPDAPREWSLDSRDRRKRAQDDDVVLRKACPECTRVYERFLPSCPHCGYKPVPAERGDIRKVDGDLMELDSATLSAMRGEVAKVDMGPEEYWQNILDRHTPIEGRRAEFNRHMANQKAQKELRHSIATWAGWERHAGLTDGAIMRKFYLKYGVDMLSAQALRERDAVSLNERVKNGMESNR